MSPKTKEHGEGSKRGKLGKFNEDHFQDHHNEPPSLHGKMKSLSDGDFTPDEAKALVLFYEDKYENHEWWNKEDHTKIENKVRFKTYMNIWR